MTKSTKLVSIIMPMRDALPYLAACLDSICAQSYTDWELILVDDGSTDGSTELARHYAGVKERITVVSNDGVGIISALKTGYRHSRGRWITRMDADDLMPEGKLQRLVMLLIASDGPTVATGQVRYFSETGIQDGYRRYAEWLNSLCLEDRHYQDIYKECVIASPNWMMARDVFESIGGFDSPHYPEDYDLVFRMYQAGLQVVSVPEVTHLWRDHGTRASRTMSQYADNRFLELKLRYFVKLELSSETRLILWGAGSKGKAVARLLVSQGLNCFWVSENKNKIGHVIYGSHIMSPKSISWSINSVVIIAVSNEQDQNDIKQSLPTDINSYVFF